MMDTTLLLREVRKRLVIAAKEVIDTAVAQGIGLPDKSQLNRLAAICGDASCAEEIGCYIRYQAGRKSGRKALWTREFAELVLGGMKVPLQEMEGRMEGAAERDKDGVRVEAWRLFAVFMTREFTWVHAQSRPAQGGGR